MIGNTSLTDKEVTTVILDNHKLAATSLTNLILESANNQLRADCYNVLKRTMEHQKQIFDVMSQKGWYQVSNANQQDITQVQQTITQAQQSVNNIVSTL
ncbi:MAG TPA: spore coat protein [Clostridiales bacterium]|nr:spore coat protein [Clostridiales bacterium]